MNMRLLGTSAAAALILTASHAFAATLTFDNFTTEQYAGDTPRFGVGSPTTVAGGAGTGFLGTSRTFTVDNTQFAGNSGLATTLESFGGLLSFNNESGARGTATLTYADVGSLNANRNNGSFFFDVVAFDGNAVFTLTGSDTSGRTLFYTEDLASGFSPTLQFRDITGSDVFDFSNVASLSFTIDTADTADSIDGRLASIQVSAVPLPASGLLLLGAFGGAAALRRRKARKAA